MTWITPPLIWFQLFVNVFICIMLPPPMYFASKFWQPISADFIFVARPRPSTAIEIFRPSPRALPYCGHLILSNGRGPVFLDPRKWKLKFCLITIKTRGRVNRLHRFYERLVLQCRGNGDLRGNGTSGGPKMSIHIKIRPFSLWDSKHF